MAAIVRGLSKLPKSSLTRSICFSASRFVGEGKDVDFTTHTGQVLSLAWFSLFAYNHAVNTVYIQIYTGLLQKVDKSIRRVCKIPLTSMYFHVCEKNYPASPS